MTKVTWIFEEDIRIKKKYNYLYYQNDYRCPLRANFFMILYIGF